MASALSDFLINDYANHFGNPWVPESNSLRSVPPASVVFEIRDQMPDIVQPAGQGVSVIRRQATVAEVIDFEDFCHQVHGANPPSSCDFIITPEAGYDYVVFDELTFTKSSYIRSFTQPTTGEEQPGKLEYAKGQLKTSIERFYTISNFLDNYEKKIALFSCRLSDKTGNGLMSRSARAFNSTISSLERMRLHEDLGNGFVFEMRVYNQEYRL